MFCNQCGKELPQGASFCTECGAKQKSVTYCRYCGSVLDDDSDYCHSCGHAISTGSQAQPQGMPATDVHSRYTEPVAIEINPRRRINKWVAFFLCLFIGVFGVHRFYEGKIGTGILYLFTLGLLGIGVIVDLIRILLKPNPYYV